MAAEAQRANSGLREQGSIARRIHAARDGRAADASIAAAFERRQIAAAALNAMDYFEGPEGQAQLAIMNDAIEAVRAATATTPLGVMLQLWCGLYELVTQADDHEALDRGDFDHFAKDHGMHWIGHLTIAAIRSLQAMGA